MAKSIAVVCGHAESVSIEQSKVMSGGVTAVASLGEKQLYVLSGFADSSCDTMPKLL